MNVVISVAEHEIEMAHRWFSWCNELGGTESHWLYLIPAAGLDINDILEKAHKCFDARVKIIKDEEGQTSDWQKTEPMRSASGPNSAFRQVAWHFYMNKIGPWFWCELDCIPTRKDWLDRLEAEYKTAVSKGKVFMGAYVEIAFIPPHLTGNSVYPMNVPEEAPTLVMRTNWTPKDQTRQFELAFDIAGAREVIPKSHFTNLIQHKFRFKGFESRAEFDAIIDPNAVVFHSDKRGTIFPYLRENLSGVGETIVHQTRERVNSATLAQPILPVCVLTDAKPTNVNASGLIECGEARESTKEEAMVGRLIPDLGQSDDPATVVTGNSRGGQKPSSVPEGRNQISASDKPKVETTGSSEEPIEWHDMKRKCSDVVTKTFKPTDELQSVIEQNSVIKNGLPAMSPPWENREDSERDVRMLCNALALFAKAPIYKSRVRQALREAKIIK